MNTNILVRYWSNLWQVVIKFTLISVDKQEEHAWPHRFSKIFWLPRTIHFHPKPPFIITYFSIYASMIHKKLPYATCPYLTLPIRYIVFIMFSYKEAQWQVEHLGRFSTLSFMQLNYVPIHAHKFFPIKLFLMANVCPPYNCILLFVRITTPRQIWTMTN